GEPGGLSRSVIPIDQNPAKLIRGERVINVTTLQYICVMTVIAPRLRFRSVDGLSGVLPSVIILTSTLSYVAFIFSPATRDALPYAVGFGLAGAGLMAIIFGLGSGVPFAV